MCVCGVCVCARFNIDRIVEGLETEVIHVMFYIEVVAQVIRVSLRTCEKLQKESPNDLLNEGGGVVVEHLSTTITLVSLSKML